jgi:hypothetical protein
MEWASIMRLMASAAKSPTLIIRDGLLRSLSLNQVLFSALTDRLEQYSRQTGNFVIGVAKKSAVLNYLSLVISLDEVLPKEEAAYIRIPTQLEVEATPASYRWMAPRSMGQLVLARLYAKASLVIPIEIPHWHERNMSIIIQSLSKDSTANFPHPGYPLGLVRAHQWASIGGINMEIMEKLSLSELRRRDPKLAKEAAIQALLGRRISEIGVEEENV